MKPRTAWNSTLPAPTKPLKRTRLKVGCRLERRTPLKAKGGRRFPKYDCPPFRRWLRTLPCFLTGAAYSSGCVIDPAHLPRAKAKGVPDLGGCVPLVHRLHLEQHRIGTPAFLRKYDLTDQEIRDVAALYAHRWRMLFPEIAAKYPPEPEVSP